MKKIQNEDLNRKSVDAFKKADKTPLIIVLDDIRSLNNIGSVFRTSDAFLIEKIYLCGITAQPPNKEIHKTALGATNTVDWEYCENVVDCIKNLQSNGVKVFAVEQVENAVLLNNFTVNSDSKYAIVLGNEVFGVSQEAVSVCDGAIEIPQLGTKHSLNISVCAGIVIWDIFVKIERMKNLKI